MNTYKNSGISIVGVLVTLAIISIAAWMLQSSTTSNKELRKKIKDRELVEQVLVGISSEISSQSHDVIKELCEATPTTSCTGGGTFPWSSTHTPNTQEYYKLNTKLSLDGSPDGQGLLCVSMNLPRESIMGGAILGISLHATWTYAGKQGSAKLAFRKARW